jgi:hypothetical protein
MNTSVLNPMEYDLFDVTSGFPIAVPYRIAQTLQNTPKFFLIDEVIPSQPRKYQLIVKWKYCFSPDPFKIRAQYGVYCNKAGFPSDIDNMPVVGSLPSNSCSTILHSDEFDLIPPNDDLIASFNHNVAEENRKDCQTYNFEYIVENKEGDLSSARVRLQLPEIPIQGSPSCVLNLLNVSAYQQLHI